MGGMSVATSRESSAGPFFPDESLTHTHRQQHTQTHKRKHLIFPAAQIRPLHHESKRHLYPFGSSVCTRVSGEDRMQRCMFMHDGCTFLPLRLRLRTHILCCSGSFVWRHMHLFGQCYYHLKACWLWIYTRVRLCLCSPSLHGSMH